MKRWTTALAACLPLALGATVAWAQEAPVEAVATIGMIGDVVAHVGGSCVAVTTLMGPGVDPHLYQPGARDVQTFQDADVIFYSGYALEGQLGAVLERFSQMKPTLAVAEASISADDLIRTEGAYGVDPHLWMDAGLWARIAPTIAEALAKARPDCADAMRANAESYGLQLAALDDWAGRAVGSIPEKQRILLTAHDAFGYYGRAYGIQVEGIQGISTEAEASVADIRAAAARVAELGVPAVFVESTINPRTIQAVIDAARQQGQEVAIGGELFSDAMGEAGTAGGTYVGMIHANTRTIVEALGGRPPALPEALQPWAEQWNVADAGAAPRPTP